MRLCLCLLIFLKLASCANILGIIPSASLSHQLPFRPIWKELSLRGHQVTVLTTDPVNDPKLINLTEIDLHFSYDIYKKYNPEASFSDPSKSSFEIKNVISAMLNETTTLQLLLPEVQNLIKNESVHFDLLITEIQYVTMIGFSWRFHCPFIGVSSLDAPLQAHEAIGNPTHPIPHPDYNLQVEDPTRLSFRERILSIIYYLFYKNYMYNDSYVRQHKKLVKFFGEELPPIEEIMNNMSLLFVNTNPVFSNIRPVNPTTIYIGDGIHVEPPQPLPKALETFMDDAQDGVIYFSLGSNIKSNLLEKEMIETFVKTFSSLPYKVLWKFDQDIADLNSNVRISKWVPQQDVLRHPNTKLFITQGGVQSLQETLIESVPVICIPFFGDQFQNCQRMLKNGVGIRMDRNEISESRLRDAIFKIVDNSSYRERAKELGTIMTDQPKSGLEKAVWWTEYVLRHKGTRHLRSPVTDMSFCQYYLLDVLGFVVGVILFALYCFYRITKFVVKKLFKQKMQ